MRAGQNYLTLRYPDGGHILSVSEFKNALSKVEGNLKGFCYVGKSYKNFNNSWTKRAMIKKNIGLVSISTLWKLFLRVDQAWKTFIRIEIDYHVFSDVECSRVFVVLKRFATLEDFRIIEAGESELSGSPLLFYYINDYFKSMYVKGKALDVVVLYSEFDTKIKNERHQYSAAYFCAKNTLYVAKDLKYLLSDQHYNKYAKFYFTFMEQRLRCRLYNETLKNVCGYAELNKSEKHDFYKKLLRL